MNAKLFLATLLADGHTIPENAHSVYFESDQVNFYAAEEFEQQSWGGRTTVTDYIHGADISFSNERIAYDTNTITFEGGEFTVAEFNEWLAANPLIVEELKTRKQIAIKRLAELGDVINAALKEGEALADELGLPFMVKLGGSRQDVRKLAAVDWDSSSMYC